MFNEKQKLAALALRFYQHAKWKPEVGDYYCLTREGLELFQISRSDGSNFFIKRVFAPGQEQGEEMAEPWPIAEFQSGFGDNPVWVPKTFLNIHPEHIVVTPERFCYSFDGELYYGSYSSRRDALKAAVGERMAGFEGTSLKDAANRELLGLTVFTARNRQPDLLSQIDGGWVIDIMQQAEDAEIEAAEDWPNATSGQVNDLTQRLRATVLEWMKLYDLEPKFWIAEDVEQHTLTSLDGLV